MTKSKSGARSPGRPRMWRQKRGRRTTIHVTREDLAYLREIGQGNVSLGVRMLVVESMRAHRLWGLYEVDGVDGVDGVD